MGILTDGRPPRRNTSAYLRRAVAKGQNIYAITAPLAAAFAKRTFRHLLSNMAKHPAQHRSRPPPSVRCTTTPIIHSSLLIPSSLAPVAIRRTIRGLNDAASSDRSSAFDRITASVADDLPRISRAIWTTPREAERTRRACGIRTR
jgi:hypothetical protein